MKKMFLWLLTISLPIGATLIGIDWIAYRTIPILPITVEGDPVIAFDPEIGFIPARQATSKRRELPAGKSVEYNLYTDRRGARVVRPGAQTENQGDILFVGDSFTWGHGVEAEDTFAHRVMKRLGVAGANVSLGSYGTTQSLQILRRNLDLAPRVVVYSFTDPQLRRNLLPCAAAYYPFCLDQSYIAWRGQDPAITSPFSNGVRRTQRHVEAQQNGLGPLSWFVHGLDVVLGKILLERGRGAADSQARQGAALEFLLNEMSTTARSADAKLLIVYIPMAEGTPLPSMLAQAAAKLGLYVTDLSPAFERHRGEGLYIPGDGHPNTRGHALIAEEITSAIRKGQFLH